LLISVNNIVKIKILAFMVPPHQILNILFHTV